MSSTLPAIAANPSLTAEDARSARASPSSGAFTSRLPVPSAQTKRQQANPPKSKESSQNALDKASSRDGSAKAKSAGKDPKQWIQLTSIEQAEAKEKQDQLAAKIQDGFREIMALDQLLKDKQGSAGEKGSTESLTSRGKQSVSVTPNVATSSLASLNDDTAEPSTFVTDLPYLSSLPYELPAGLAQNAEEDNDATPSLKDDEQLKDNLVTAQKDFLKRNMEVSQLTLFVKKRGVKVTWQIAWGGRALFPRVE